MSEDTPQRSRRRFRRTTPRVLGHSVDHVAAPYQAALPARWRGVYVYGAYLLACAVARKCAMFYVTDRVHNAWRRGWQFVLIVGFPAWLLTACALSPRYQRPTVQVPEAYKEIEGWKVAQPSDALSRGRWWEIFQEPQLNALVEQVSVSNQTLAVAEAQWRGARAAIGLARAAHFPTVTASAAATGSRPSLNRTGGGQNELPRANYQLPLDLAYEFDLWGRIRQTVDANTASAQASAADVESVRLSLQAELAMRYFALHGIDAQKHLLSVTISGFEKALELTLNRYNQGVASQLEVAQARTQLENIRAQMIDLGVQRAQLEHAIAILIGQPPSALALPYAPLLGPPPPIPVEIPSTLLERRPDIAAAERRVAAANAQVGIARTAFYPTVTLRSALGFESSSLLNLFSWPSVLWSLGTTAVQTAFDGGRRQAVTAQAQASYEATVATYRQTVLTAFQDVEDQLAILRLLEEEVAQQSKAQETAEMALILALNRYKAGITTYLEVITAQTTALAASRTAVDLLTRRMIASVLLIKALGGGWEQGADSLAALPRP